MAKKDRTGNRSTRQHRTGKRVPDLGYYLIVTDTEGTERCYFEGLHDLLPVDIRDRLVIKVVETHTENMINKCLQYTAYDSQYREPWIVFDRDQVVDFDKIIRDAARQQICVGWSNPCFEIWMFAYYGNMPHIQDSWNCCRKFSQLYYSKSGQEYSKADKNLYKRIADTGDEERAVKVAELRMRQHIDSGVTKPSEMCPGTSVYKLVSSIRERYKKSK